MFDFAFGFRLEGEEGGRENGDTEGELVDVGAA
jgi:hypothetical protein